MTQKDSEGESLFPLLPGQLGRNHAGSEAHSFPGSATCVGEDSREDESHWGQVLCTEEENCCLGQGSRAADQSETDEWVKVEGAWIESTAWPFAKSY